MDSLMWTVVAVIGLKSTDARGSLHKSMTPPLDPWRLGRIIICSSLHSLRLLNLADASI